MQISQLDSEVTKLRAQQEKGEAVRQDLELQLTKSKRDVSNEKRNVSEREALINEINESMKRKLKNAVIMYSHLEVYIVLVKNCGGEVAAKYLSFD